MVGDMAAAIAFVLDSSAEVRVDGLAKKWERGVVNDILAIRRLRYARGRDATTDHLIASE
jgi:hypothetical protein